MPDMMSALCGRAGSASFTVERVEVPIPGPGQVRIKVRAAAFNHVDQWVLAGTYRGAPGSPTDDRPYIAGIEYVGEVDALGPDVDGARVGDRVLTVLAKIGSFADYAVIDAANLVPLPAELGWTDAAALRVGLVIGRDALIERAGFEPGRSVLVLGGTSGMGSMTVQLAKAFGASLVLATTRSAAKKERLADLGVDVVIATDEDDLTQTVLDATGGDGVDIVIDYIGGTTLSDALAATRVRGTVVLIGSVSDRESTLSLGTIASRLLRIVGTAYDARTPAERRAIADRLPELLTLVLDGRVRPVVDSVHRFPEECQQAFERLTSGDTVGKVILEMS